MRLEQLIREPLAGLQPAGRDKAGRAQVPERDVPTRSRLCRDQLRTPLQRPFGGCEPASKPSGGGNPKSLLDTLPRPTRLGPVSGRWAQVTSSALATGCADREAEFPPSTTLG
jgi:hypothetical protein